MKRQQEDPRESARIGPRQLKDPNSVDFAWQTVALMKRRYQTWTISEKQWQETLDEAERYRIFEKIPPESPYGSLDAMLKAEIGVDTEESKREVKSRQQAAQQAGANNTEPVREKAGNPTGVNQYTKRNADDLPKCKDYLQYGNRKDYRVRRMLKDYGERGEEARKRLEAGEFKSVAAAERFARGEEPHPPYPKKTELMWLQHWWKRADEETRQEFDAWREGGAA